MVIAVLEMTLPRGNEAATIGALPAFWDSTCARPGCTGGGVFPEAGGPKVAFLSPGCSGSRGRAGQRSRQETQHRHAHDWRYRLERVYPVFIEFDQPVIQYPSIRRFPGGASNDLMPNLQHPEDPVLSLDVKEGGAGW